MTDVLLTHSYHLPFDRKQVRKMQPYPPLGTLYAAALLRQQGLSVALFDTMLTDPAGFGEALNFTVRRSLQSMRMISTSFRKCVLRACGTLLLDGRTGPRIRSACDGTWFRCHRSFSGVPFARIRVRSHRRGGEYVTGTRTAMLRHTRTKFSRNSIPRIPPLGDRETPPTSRFTTTIRFRFRRAILLTMALSRGLARAHGVSR